MKVITTSSEEAVPFSWCLRKCISWDTIYTNLPWNLKRKLFLKYGEAWSWYEQAALRSVSHRFFGIESMAPGALHCVPFPSWETKMFPRQWRIRGALCVSVYYLGSQGSMEAWWNNWTEISILWTLHSLQTSLILAIVTIFCFWEYKVWLLLIKLSHPQSWCGWARFNFSLAKSCHFGGHLHQNFWRSLKHKAMSMFLLLLLLLLKLDYSLI